VGTATENRHWKEGSAREGRLKSVAARGLHAPRNTPAQAVDAVVTPGGGRREDRSGGWRTHLEGSG